MTANTKDCKEVASENCGMIKQTLLGTNLTLNLENCSVDQLKVIKEEIETEISKAEQLNELVNSFSHSEGFPYAIFEVFSALQDGVTVLSEDLTILWVNESFVKQLKKSDEYKGFSKTEIIGKSCYFSLNQNSPCPDCSCVKAMKTKKTIYHKGHHGSLKNIAYEAWAIPIYNGHTACILITREI